MLGGYIPNINQNVSIQGAEIPPAANQSVAGQKVQEIHLRMREFMRIPQAAIQNSTVTVVTCRARIPPAAA